MTRKARFFAADSAGIRIPSSSAADGDDHDQLNKREADRLDVGTLWLGVSPLAYPNNQKKIRPACGIRRVKLGFYRCMAVRIYNTD
ncbi:MAG: hypothetical protein R3C45_21240 [Phycisphaerales bacterium]